MDGIDVVSSSADTDWAKRTRLLALNYAINILSIGRRWPGQRRAFDIHILLLKRKPNVKLAKNQKVTPTLTIETEISSKLISKHARCQGWHDCLVDWLASLNGQ